MLHTIFLLIKVKWKLFTELFKYCKQDCGNICILVTKLTLVLKKKKKIWGRAGLEFTMTVTPKTTLSFSFSAFTSKMLGIIGTNHYPWRGKKKKKNVKVVLKIVTLFLKSNFISQAPKYLFYLMHKTSTIQFMAHVHGSSYRINSGL